jgi:pre-mRNA-processing factor 19
VTKESLSVDDLIAVQPQKWVNPRPEATMSVPGLLSAFHNEWDALMLETHALRKELQTTRQELSHALYQHDAACRVIARMMKERDDARDALANAKGSAKRSAADAGEPESKKKRGGISADIIAKMEAMAKERSGPRKKRTISSTLATTDDISGYDSKVTQALHKTTSGGINAIAIKPSDENIIATASTDHTVAIFDKASSQRVQQLSGHSKKVHDVKFAGDNLLSAGADKIVKLWGSDGAEKAVFSDHTADVTSVSVHPSNSYFVSTSLDKTWGFHDIASGTCITLVNDDTDSAITCGSFHPDGVILGMGTKDAAVKLWDAKESRKLLQLDGHTNDVTGLSFSENGYYLATSAKDGVKVWDLRKSKIVHEIECRDAHAVAFDHSGSYLAIGGHNAQIYQVKGKWDMLKEFKVAKTVKSVAFGGDARSLAVGSTDHNLRIFA